jgi:hypothetical protein
MNEMKKLLRRPVAAALALLLAAVLAPCPTFADTPGATPEPAATEEPIPVPVDNDYYDYDPDAPWLYYDMTEGEYYEEFEPWRATGQTEEEYWDEYWKNYEVNRRTEALLEFGFTDTDGPNVAVNGEPLNFTGAKPLVRSGATMIPARAVFEALGAEVGYDGKAKTVTVAASDATVAFTVGSDTARVARDGLTEEIELTAAPFIDGGVAYVPLRASAEGLGFEVYWDSFYKVADIIDKNGLIAQVDAKFTVLNALLQSEINTAPARLASGRAERTDVKFTVDATARYDPDYYDSYGENVRSSAKEGDAKLAGAFTVLSGESGFDVSGDAKLEINGFEDILGEIDQDFELQELLADLKKGVPFDLIVDYEEAALYLQLPLLSYAEPLLDKNTWIVSRTVDEYDLAFAFQQTKEAMDAFLAEGGLTVGKVLYASLIEGPGDNLDPFGSYAFYRSAGVFFDTARMMEPFLGDAYMEKRGDTYTIDLNRLELFNVFSKIEKETELYLFDVDDYADFLSEVAAAHYTLRIGTKGGVPESMEIAINAKLKLDSYSDADDGYIEFRYGASASPQKASADYSISVKDADAMLSEGSLQMHVDAVIAPTDEEPRTAPPAGSKVVSFEEL